MKIQFSFGESQDASPAFSLDRMISRMLRMFQPVAARHHSFIINDVTPGFAITTNSSLLERAIGSLLVSVISRSHESCIRITAKRYNDVILLGVKDNKGQFSKDLENGLYATQLLAAKIGGCVITNNMREKESSVTFTFLNSLPAA